MGVRGTWLQADAVSARKLVWILHPGLHRAEHGLHVQGLKHLWDRQRDSERDATTGRSGAARAGALHLPSHCLKPSSPTAIWSWG